MSEQSEKLNVLVFKPSEKSLNHERIYRFYIVIKEIAFSEQNKTNINTSELKC